MAYFREIPYTTLSQLNLDWLIKGLQNLETEIGNFVALNTIKYANPFDWDITTQYAMNTLVFNPADYTAYLSVKPVPSGVQIDNTDYWTPVFTLADVLTAYRDAITPVFEQAGGPATSAIEKGQLFWIGNKICVATSDIAKGDTIAIGTNCAYTSVSAELLNFVDSVDTLSRQIATETTNRENADSTLSQQIATETANRENADSALSRQITTETTDRENADAALSQQIQQLANRAVTGLNLSRVVFIGDSFTQGYGLPSPDTQNFAYQFCAGLGITDYQIFGGGGVGFYHVSASLGVDALDYFKSIESQITSPETVTTVFVCLGWNDRSEPTASIQNSEKSFFQYIKPVFPKANIIYFANPGYSVIKKQSLAALYNTAQNSGITCVDSHYWMLLDENSFQSDYVHPNTAGHQRIASHLRNIIFGGQPFNYQILTGFAVDGYTATVTVINSIAVIYLSGNKNSTERATRIASFPDRIFYGNGYNTPRIPFRYMVPLGNSNSDFGFTQWDSNNLNIYACSMANVTTPGNFSSGTFTANITMSAVMFLG